MEANTEADVLKCKKCGLESTIKEAFVVKKYGDQVHEAVCFECAIKKESKSNLINWALFALILLMLIYNGLVSKQEALGLLAGLLLVYPLILLHELSHAGAALLLGFRVFGIHLGASRVVFSARLFGTRWFIRRVPTAGATVISGPLMRHFALRKFIIILAGPALHALLIPLLVYLWVDGLLFNPSWLEAMIFAQVLLNAFILLINLIPRKTPIMSYVKGTDGYQMLQILKGKKQTEDFSIYYALETLDALDRGDLAAAHRWCDTGLAQYPEKLVMLNAETVLLMRSEEYGKGREQILRQLESDPPPVGAMKYVLYNNLAYANLMLEDPSLLPEADELSGIAYKNMSWEHAMISTRGEVLVALGQIDEGIVLLKQALRNNTNSRIDQALDTTYLARAEFRRGRIGEAMKYLAKAEKLDAKCALLNKVKMEMAGQAP